MTSQAPSQSHSRFHAILPHPVEPAVLMLSEGDNWSLPCVVLDGKVWPSEAGRINAAMRQVLGVPVTVQRCADVRRDSAATDGFRAVIVLETHNPIREVPPGAQWVTRERLADLRLTQAGHRPVIEECLAEAAGAPIPALRPPWERRGWFGQAVSWIQTQLTQLDLRPTGPVEQIRTWGISCVLRSPTTHGEVYFKVAAALPLFADEPSLIASLAGLHPRNIPAPLTIERRRHWMLLPDVGLKLRGSPDVSRWQEALRLFGEIQRASVGRTDSLLAMGCVDRRLHRLALQINPLFNDAGALASLDAADLTQVRALAPRLAAMCTELADLGVPQTLVHGDLHAGNIAIRDGAYMFFDWTDGCVSHPFFDLVPFLEDAARLADAPDAQARLRDTYLEPWTVYAPMARLQEAWGLARPLGALHQAISYQHIVTNLEPASRVEQDWAPFYLREILRLMTMH